MNDDVEQLSAALDDMVAERDPTKRSQLSHDVIALTQTAAMIRAAKAERLLPSDRFVDELATRVVEVRGDGESPVDIARSDPDLSRRSALWKAVAAVAGVAVGGAGLTGAYEIGRSRTTLQESDPLTAPMVPLDRGVWQATGYTVSAVSEGSAMRFRAGAVEGFLVNPGSRQALYALSASCTHMGCMISWIASAGTFLCPCHGAQYNANGTVLSGIARHPLPHLRIRVLKNGSVDVWSVDEHPKATTLEPYSRA